VFLDIRHWQILYVPLILGGWSSSHCEPRGDARSY
jgi:hypothetical protein